MNEELLLEIFNNKGYNTGGSFDDFKKSMMDSPDLRRAVYDKDFTTGGSYTDFEKSIGVTRRDLPNLPTYGKGPVGVSRPPIMANPGMDDKRLKDYYMVDEEKLTNSLLAAGPARESMRPNELALGELAKGGQAEKEKKAADFLNRSGDVLQTAKSIYTTEYKKKQEDYSKDPQIADAEFSFEALGVVREHAKLVSDRSKERLKMLYKDRYSESEIDRLVNTHAALSLMGNTEAANKMVKDNPELFSDPNVNNILAANQRLRDVSLAESHVIRNNPNWLKRQEKIRERQQEVDLKDMVIDATAQVSPGAILMHPNIGNSIKSRVGSWAKNLATGPGWRDWGRDQMDFNPKSSDYMGRAIETFKKVSVGNQSYDVVYDNDKVSYIRDPKTGYIIHPEPEQMKAINEAAKGKETSTRFNAKPFVGQTTDVVLDMAPIVALTWATGGLGSAAGLSLTTARGIGVVAGSALQTRGELMDQMLLHPDISPAEAEMYTLGIGLGVGALSLINPIESKLISSSVAGIAKKNVGRLMTGEITKGQLAWEITKEVAKVAAKEPLEEILQEGWQHVALKGVDALQPGYGKFDNPTPGLDDLTEIALVSAAVGLLGGAGSIRTNRNTFIDEALDKALSKPKLVEDYMTEMEISANAIQDETKKQEALDHIARIKSRWESVKSNVDAVKGLDGKKRGQLAALIADSNQLESELKGVTNEAVKATKMAQIKLINDEIKNLIDPQPAAAATTTTTTTDAAEGVDQDIDRAAVDNIGLIADEGAEIDVDYFESGQKIKDGVDEGVITDVHKNTDGTTHSIEVEYTSEGAPLSKTIVVAKKTPKEIGIQILDSKGTPKTEKKAPVVETATNTTDSEAPPEQSEAAPTKASIPVMITKKMEADLRTKGLTQEQIDKLTPQEANDILNEQAPEQSPLDPGIKAEIDKENTRLSQQRTQALADLKELTSIDPDLDAEPIRQQIEDDYNAGVRQVNVSARKNFINKKRDADIKKAKDTGKRIGKDVVALGTIDRINRNYDDQIAAIEKEFGVADELKNEAAAKKDVVTGEIEGQRDEKLFPRKDYESNPAFQSIQKKYQKSKGKVYGKPVSRTLPSGEKVTGKYVLINKNDMAASHLPNSFTKTPGVPVTPSGNTFNDNDYETSKNAQATQTRIAKNFDERAIDDIVFVDANGIVKSGNGRTISRQMSSAENSKSYLDALKARAEEFGFTEKQIKAIGDDNVMLAVELEGDPVYNTKEYSKFNATAEKQKSPLQKAIAIAKSIGEKTIGLIANVFDQADVMSDLSPRDVQHIRDILLKAGIITELDQAQYFDENDHLTAAGSEFVENILLSSVFNEDELRILAITPKLRKKLSQNRVRLLKNSQKGRLSIVPKIRQALYLINSAKQFEGTFESRLLQQITQGSLFNVAGEIDAETISIALILNNAAMLRKALDQLNSAEEAADLFGNTVSSDEIVNHTLESLKADLNEEGKKLIDIASAIPRSEAKNIAPATPVSRDQPNEQVNVKPSDPVDTSTPGEETEGEPKIEDDIDLDQDEQTPLYKVWDITRDENLSDDEKVSVITEYITPFLQGLSPAFKEAIARSGDNPNATVDEIASEYAKAEVYGVIVETDLLDYVREIIRNNYFEEYLPSMAGDFPNANGVYDEDKAEAHVYERKVKGWKGLPEADIHVLQLSDKSWIVSRGYYNHKGDFAGSSGPLSFHGKRYDTREEAITEAAYDIIAGHRDQKVKDWAHHIIELVGGEQPELPPIDQPFFQETNVAPQPKKKSKPKKAKPATASSTQEKLSDIDNEINDIFDYFKKLSIAATPEQQAEDMKMGIRLINLYIQKGVYTIKGIVEDMLQRMDAVTAERIFPYVQQSYLAIQSTVDDSVLDQMDDTRTVRSMNVQDVVTTTIQEYEPTAEEEVDEAFDEFEAEEEADSEGEPGDTQAIIDAAETALSQAEVAATAEEIEESLNALEDAISRATSKLGQLVTSYQIDGILHERPSVEIAKAAKKDITKHAKEIARLTGWEAKHIYANIPPAGGEVGMTFAIPNTTLSVHAWVKYDPQEVSPYDDYLFMGMMYRLERVEPGGRVKSVTTNQLVYDSMSAKEVASTFFKAAKPYMAKELTTPVEIPEGIKPAEPDLGPLFAAKPIKKSPTFEGKSEASGTGKRNRNRSGGRKLDPTHQGFQQGLLFGTEPERDTQPSGETEGDTVRGRSDEVGGDREISTGGRGGSRQDVSVSGTLPVSRKDQAAAHPATNFHFPNNYTGPSTFHQPQRFRDNLDALRTLQTLLKEKRDALPEEQEILSKYVGWGGIKVILNNEKLQWSDADDKMRPLVAELKELIADLEKELGLKDVLRGIKGSVLNAHYTSIPIIRSMYSILYRMGFNGGKVLEPSAGIGNFIGAMPGLMAGNSQLHAIELEQLTGHILKKLYPKSMSTIGGYETMKYPSNNFDLAISNVPFGNYRVFTEPNAPLALKKAGSAIHNYFFVRALDQVKEGGLIAFISTAATLDTKGNQFVREHLNENADFLGAIRLPSNAFQGNAGTQVVTDIIFLRKNVTGERNNPPFLNLHPVQVQHKNNGKDITIQVNEYFINNPDHVIGEFRAGGLYAEDDMTVVAPRDLDVAAEILKLESKFPKDIFNPQNVDHSTERVEQQEDGEEFVADLQYYVGKDGKPYINNDGEAQAVPKTHAPKIPALIQLRDTVRRQFDLELYSDSEPAIEENRKEMGRLYDAFVKKYGYLNSQKNKSFVTRDSFGYNLIALEEWDKTKNAAKKGDLFFKRQMNRIRRAESASSYEDAVAISINETAKVDLHRMAELLGQDPEQVFEQGYGLFFKDPDGRIIERSEYLSGNVKQKLSQAREMAEVDPLFAKNVEALEAVIPEDIPYTLIDVNLGSRWVPTEYYEHFLQQLLNTRSISVEYSRAADLYTVEGERTVDSTTKYGTPRRNVYELMTDAMQGKAPVVKDLVDPGPPKKYEVNQAETQAARDKLTDLVNLFEEWIWTDHDRAKKLEKIYNDLFNTSVKRNFEGTNFHVDGLNKIILAEHQKAAAAMLFLNNGGIVDHIVGAGKTFVMISAAIKMKQTGVANKPTIIALKSTIKQIQKDAEKAFPSARILAPSEKDFQKKNRKALLARIQNNDWDLVIMSHDQFKFIPQDPEFESQLINEEIDAISKEVEAIIEAGGKENKRMRTALENRIKKLEERLEKVQGKGRKDTELMNFKEIGIDHIFVDESQQFKNLPYATKINNVAGLGNPAGSSRAFNLLTAIRTLQALHGGDKGTTFLSGTPISNSLVEMYLLLKYLRPTRMKELGYDTFDAWSKNAAKQSDELEFSVTGTVKSKARFRTFINIPEVTMLYTEIADVRNENNITLERPSIRGGEAKLVTVEQNEEQQEMTARLIEFANQKHGERDGRLIGKPDLTESQQTAAMLLVTGLSTKLSVDMRLIDPRAEFNPNGKLAAVANTVYTEYVNSEAIKGTQLVFCDVGTPKSGNVKEDLRDFLQDERGVIEDDLVQIFGEVDKPKKQTIAELQQALKDILEYTDEQITEVFQEAKSTSNFNAYDGVKELLIEKGIPANEIAFIHSYKTDAQKKKLFDDVNDGIIRVVLGSTQKLGTGVNVQRRVVALHHIDASWTPSAMTQRNGRGIRQGNMNKEVAIYNYGTEQTLDAYKYQLIATKQKFIDQVKTGATGERTYKEGDGEDMSAQSFVALLSGNPLLLEKAKVDSEVDKLKRAKRGYDSEQYTIKSKISEAKEGITRLTAAIANREEDLKVVKANSTIVTEEVKEMVDSLEHNFDHLKSDPRLSNFEVKMLKRPGSDKLAPFLVYTKSRLEPNVVIRGKVPKDSEERNKWMDAITADLKKKHGQALGGEEIIGKAAGLDIVARVTLKDRSLLVNYFLEGNFEYATSPSTFSPAINKIEPDIAKAKDALEERKDTLSKLQDFEGKPWPKKEDYDAALKRQKEIDTELKRQEAAKSDQPPKEFDEDDEAQFSITENNGEIILHHGTNQEFDIFDETRKNTGEGGALFGAGFYLTNNPKVADFYAGQIAKKEFAIGEQDSLFGTTVPIYPADADEKAAPKKRILSFAVRGNFLDAENYIIEPELEKLIIDLWDQHSGFPAKMAKERFEWMRTPGNKEKINNYRGELDYIIMQVGFADKQIVNGIVNYLQDNGYDGIKYPSDRSYEGEGSYNYVIYNKDAIVERTAVNLDPFFSMQEEAVRDAKEAIDSGNPNPNAPIIISLRDANATPNERLQQYAGVWLDQIQKGNKAFIDRGLELIKDTEYATDAMAKGLNYRTALINAIADHAEKLPKDHKLISWVKQFWQKVGKLLKLNIEPDQLRELTIEQYLDIAATQIRYGNDIYAELVADGVQVTDNTKIPTPATDTAKTLADRQKAIEEELEAKATTFEAEKADPVVVRTKEPSISVEKELEFESRDLNAIGSVFSNPRGPEAERLLRNYSGAKKRLIETVFLLFPTLKNAGITLTFHETPDSYYNAVVSHNGTRYQAVSSGGIYRAKEIHINLSKPDLKENTALHEAFHPIIRDILVNDRATFTKFINDILKDPELRSKYHDNFAQRYANLKPDAIAEEILVEASADIVLDRILRNMENMPETLFDRILGYIKKALGDTYGQLIQFVNTRNSFAEFAHSMADAISQGMAVPVNADINDSVKTIVNESIQLSQDSDVSLLSQVFSKSGQINHEKVKRIAKQVVEGTARIRRLNSAEEQGRIAGGKRNVEISILLGASERAGTNAQQRLSGQQSEVERQIQLIQNYASQQGILFPLSKIEQEYEFLDDGAEADVYVDDIADYVLKIVKINPIGKDTPLRFLDERVSLHNYLFPDTKLELIGIATDGKYLHFMLRQPFIQVDGKPTSNQLEAHMSKYYKANQNMNTGSPETSFINSNYLIEDLHEKNVLRSKGGMLHFIDTFSKLNTPADGYGGSRDYEEFDIVQQPVFDLSAQFSMQSPEEQRREEIIKLLKHRILTNEDVNFEPIVDNLIKKGILTKAHADTILQGWRQKKLLNLSTDKALEAIQNMAELIHLSRKDEEDNLQINNANMQRFIDDHDGAVEAMLDRYNPYTLKNLVEEVSGSGLAHPSVVLDELHKLNNEKNPTAAGPKLTIAIGIAFSELEKAKKVYQKMVEQTGSIDASEQVQYIDDIIHRLANAAKVNGSIAGASLGIRSKLIQLAGLTYQSQLSQLELINKSKAGRNVAIDENDKAEIKRLVNEVNALQEALDKALLAANPKKNKQVAAQNAFQSKIRSSLESRPTMTKQEALEHLKRMRAVRASFSLALSADPPEYTYYDIVNELVKIAHEEGAKGFKNVVEKVLSYDSTITEDDIYNAILSTTTQAQQRARSEYAKRQATTRKHVKDINNVEAMLTKQVADLLRKQKMPDEQQINEFGKLLKEIEKNIYQMDASNELVVSWANALESIKNTYALAFLSPTPTESTDIMLGKIINAVRILKDQKFHQWLEAKNKELDEELALINAGKVSQLVDQDDLTHRSLPTEMVVPEFNQNGDIIGTKIVPYNFGAMDRLIRDKKLEIEKVKAKYRKGSVKDTLKLWYRTARGTVGSAMAMADLSYFAIQGFRMFATFGLRSPRTFGHAFKMSLRAMRDEFRKNPGLSNEIYRQITENPYYERAVAMGLVITSPDSHIFVNEMLGEEDLFDMAHTATKGRKNIFATSARVGLGARKRIKMASNAAFATHLNLLSMNTFAAYVEKVKKATGELPSNEELVVLAREINNSTGRTTRLADQTKSWGQIFWAPKLYLSQILNLGNIVGDPANFLYHYAKGNKDMARVYGHRTINSVLFASTMAGLYVVRLLIAKAQCGDAAALATNEYKTDYLKIKCGELTMDPSGNHRQWFALGARILAAGDGDPITDFTGKPVGTVEQIMNMFKYKLNPLISTGVQLWGATDFLGRPRIPDDQSTLKWKSRALIILDHMKPISGGALVGVYRAKDVAPISKPFSMAEALLGFGVNYIDTEAEMERKEIEKAVKARKKEQTNDEGLKTLQKRFGALEELQGKFEGKVPAETLEPTSKRYSDRSGSYRVFKRTDDPNENGLDDDFYIVKIRKSGDNKGKKYLENRIDKDRIR